MNNGKLTNDGQRSNPMGRHAGPYDPDPGSQTEKALITNRGQFGQPANEGVKSGSNVVFPEIKNVSRVTGNCRQVDQGGTQPLDFGKTTQSMEPMGNNRFSSTNSYLQGNKNRLSGGQSNHQYNNTFGAQSFNHYHNESTSNESSPNSHMGSQFIGKNRCYKNVRNFGGLYPQGRSQSNNTREMQQDLKLGLKKVAMRMTNEPKLPALTNFKSMHVRHDQSETSSQVGNVNGSFMKSPGNQQANKYYATNNSFAGKSLNLKNQGAVVMKKGPGGLGASTFSQLSMPRALQPQQTQPSITQSQFTRVKTEQTQRPGLPANSGENPLAIYDSPGGFSNQMGHPKLQPTPVSHSNLPHQEGMSKMAADTQVNASPRKVSDHLNTSMNMQQQQLYGFTHDIIEEGTSLGDGGAIDQGTILNKLKPLLKKPHLHLGNQTILTWKSFEIWLIQQANASEPGSQPKIHNPIYVPMQQAEQLLTMNLEQIEVEILKNLDMSTNGRSFVYNAPEIVTPPVGDGQSDKSEKEADDLEEIFPEEIQTSIYMQQTNTDYRVVLRMPTLEYAIESTHFLYMKTMTRTEARSFFNTVFYNWHKDATKILLNSRQFNEQVAKRANGANPQTLAEQDLGSRAQLAIQKVGQKQPSAQFCQIFVEEVESGKLCQYKSVAILRRERFLRMNGSTLRGRFQRNGTNGRIEIKPFAVSVRGLDSQLDHREVFTLPQWENLIGYMQQKGILKPDNPEQIIERVARTFIRQMKSGSGDSPQKQMKEPTISLLHIVDRRADKPSFKVLNDKDVERIVPLLQKKSPQKTAAIKLRVKPGDDKNLEAEALKRHVFDAKKAIKTFIKQQKRSKILNLPVGTTSKKVQNPEELETQRFLVELEFPTVEVVFKDQTFKKNLMEDDLRYLAVANFKQWSNFVMTRHFRLELNIGAEAPLQKIIEDKRGEDGDLLSEADPRELYPVKEEERINIENTRNALCDWFPI